MGVMLLETLPGDTPRGTHVAGPPTGSDEVVASRIDVFINKQKQTNKEKENKIFRPTRETNEIDESC